MKAEAYIYEKEEYEAKYKKLVTMSLAGLLIGSLLFIFGISVKETVIPLIVNYAIAMILYICSFLAIYNNHKIFPTKIFKFIMILAIFFMIFISYATFIELL